MAVDPSPMTILPGEHIVELVEVEPATLIPPAYIRQASPVADLPVSTWTSEVAMVVDVIPSREIQDDIMESIKMKIETQDEKNIESSIPSIQPSRATTPDIVKSKFEALGMFSGMARLPIAVMDRTSRWTTQPGKESLTRMSDGS